MHSPRSQAGFVLIPVLLILALLMGLAVALNTSVTMDSGLNAGYNRATAGFYTAESGLDVGMDGFRNKFLQFQVPCSATSSSCTDFNTQTYPLSARTVSYQLQDPGGNPVIVPVPAGHTFAGLNSVQYTYLINSQSLNNSVTEASVGAEFDINNIPLFQFLAFYTGDLEIMPGANMTMHGRVHTNGDLYLNSDATLQITTNATIPIVQVTAKGSIHRGRKDTGACNGTVQVQTSGTSPTLQTLGCNGSTTSAVVPTPTLAAWHGSMVSGVGSIAVPTPGITGINSQYWLSADMRIALQLNPTNPGPHSILVLNTDGTTNTSMTNLLKQFMNDSAFNQSKSDYKGTKPVFITDVPLATPGPGCNCNPNTFPPTGCSAIQQNCYWGIPMPTFTPPPTPTNTPNSATTRTPTATATRTFTPPAASPTNTPTFGNDHSFYGLDRIYSTNTWATLQTPTPSNPTPAAGGSMFRDNDPRRGGFYNWREQTWMYLLNVNLRELLQWNIDYKAANGAYAFFDPTTGDPSNTDPTHTAKGGPVIYLTVLGPNSNGLNNYGVRIFGSKVLPFPAPVNPGDPTGITVVSDQAIYLAGDYNNPQTINSTVYPKMPAALMGDSVNVLSNAALPIPTPGYVAGACTNDCQSILSMPSRDASVGTTTVNAAFIGGVDLTTSSNYNGGLENYFRFHEDWTGTTLAYRGSFVSLGTPNHVDGAWCGTNGSSTSTTVTGCNMYNPPTRNYDYDSDFNDVRNLPPMTPRFVYVQQIVFTENFN